MGNLNRHELEELVGFLLGIIDDILVEAMTPAEGSDAFREKIVEIALRKTSKAGILEQFYAPDDEK